MSRLISVTRQVTPAAARHEWHVADEGRPFQRMDPSRLLEKLGAVASELVGPGVVATGVERLQVFDEVRAGDHLLITAALEPERHRRRSVSIVVRKDRQVLVAGVLSFVPLDVPDGLSPAQRHRVRSSARDGRSLVETVFHARAADDDWLLRGNPLEWVHASAVLSAQGYVAGPADFIALQAVSRLGPVSPGTSLVLQCSVVHVDQSVVSVLSHVRTEVERRDVLWAISSFRAQRDDVAPLLRAWPDWLGVSPPET